MQIVGDPVGGIRKHVHAILEGLNQEEIVMSYSYSMLNMDSRFKEEIPHIRKRIIGEIPLLIRKRPGLRDAFNLFSLARYVSKNRVDIVHGHGAKGGLYARVLSLFCGVKSVYTPHGGAVHKMFSPAEERIYVAAEKLMFRMTDYFIFESRYTADAYHAKVGRVSNNWEVNYNGIALPNMDEVAARSAALGYGHAQDVLKIGVFGILRPEKGQIHAINAVNFLTARGYKVCLHLFGDGPDREKLKQTVKDFNLADSVIFHSEVSEVEPHMYGMDIILIPSLFESFGYVALEAMSLGKLVVASKVGGLAETIDENTGVFIEPVDSTAIAAAIERYIKDPEAYSTLASNGYNKIKNVFNVNRMIYNISLRYKELCK